MKIDSDGYERLGSRRFHVIVAERALGKPLPKGAMVHHVNEIKNDNANSNLVICQDNAYHRLLHYRAKAYEVTGNADSIKCGYCGGWASRTDPAIEDYSDSSKPYRFWHKTCQRAYNKNAPNAPRLARERRAKRIGLGYCVTCGELREQTEKDRTRCRECASKMLARRNLRIATGNCGRCGKERGKDGTTATCRICADRQAKDARRYKAARRARILSEQAHEIAARVIEVLERDDRLNGTLSEANIDALAEEVKRVMKANKFLEDVPSAGVAGISTGLCAACGEQKAAGEAR